MKKYKLVLSGLLFASQMTFADTALEPKETKTTKQVLTQNERMQMEYLVPYPKRAQDLHNLQKKDEFAARLEEMGHVYTEVAKKLREIKAKHVSQIAKGDYREYLEHVAGFLAGCRQGYFLNLDMVLMDINMLRQASREINLK